MPWTYLIHDCLRPGRADIRLLNVEYGSQWECPEPGCKRVWNYVGYGVGDNVEWKLQLDF